MTEEELDELENAIEHVEGSSLEEPTVSIKTGTLIGLTTAARRWAKAEAFLRAHGDSIVQGLVVGTRSLRHRYELGGWRIHRHSQGEVTTYDSTDSPGLRIFVADIDWSSLPNPPPAPLTGNDGTGGQQAASEGSDPTVGTSGFEPYGITIHEAGPTIEELDEIARTARRRANHGEANESEKTTAERRALYEAGRASLAKRIELLEGFVEWALAHCPGEVGGRIMQLRSELSAGGTKGT